MWVRTWQGLYHSYLTCSHQIWHVLSNTDPPHCAPPHQHYMGLRDRSAWFNSFIALRLGFWQVRFLQMCTVYSNFHYRHVFVLTSFLVNVLLSSITRAFRRLSISRCFSIYFMFNKTCAAWYWLAISHGLMHGPTLTNTFLVIEWVNGIYYIISG